MLLSGTTGKIPYKFNVGFFYLEIGFNCFAFRRGDFDLNNGVWFDRSTGGLKKFRKFGMVPGKSSPGIFYLK